MNNENPHPKTARDALIVELMGDIGIMHDTIKRLPDDIKQSISIIAMALEDAEKTGEEIKNNIQLSLSAVVSSEIEKTKVNIESELKEKLDKALSSATQNILNLEKKSRTFSVRDKHGTILNYILGSITILTIISSAILAYVSYHHTKDANKSANYWFHQYKQQEAAIKKLPTDTQERLKSLLNK